MSASGKLENRGIEFRNVQSGFNIIADRVKGIFNSLFLSQTGYKYIEMKPEFQYYIKSDAKDFSDFSRQDSSRR